MPNGYEGPERRREVAELERWRGEIGQRVLALETTVASLVRSHESITRKQIELEGQVKDVGKDVREAAASIEEGRQESVKELKGQIAAGGLRRMQVIVAVLVAVLAPIVSTLITLAITGGGHP